MSRRQQYISCVRLPEYQSFVRFVLFVRAYTYFIVLAIFAFNSLVKLVVFVASFFISVYNLLFLFLAVV